MYSAVENRISRRKFEKEPITDGEREKIISLIHQLNEASGLTMAFVEDGSGAFQKLRKSYGLFTNVRSLILMKGKKDDKDLKENHALGLVFYELTAIVLRFGKDEYYKPVNDKINAYRERLIYWQENIDKLDLEWASFLMDDNRPNKEKLLNEKKRAK